MSATTATTTKAPTKKQLHAQEMQEAREYLRSILKPGDTIFCVLRHVSTSGMSRRISFFGPDNVFLDGYISKALDIKRADKNRSGQWIEGLIIGGAGMDMGFHVVYELGHALWPNGTPEPHGYRNGEPDSEGGYALKHRWL